ncbi:hypothetical protein ACFL02_06160 [Planctomycetota bacterium]
MHISKTLMFGVVLSNLIVFSMVEAQVVGEQEAALKVLLQRRLADEDPRLKQILAKAETDNEFRLGLIAAIRQRLDSYDKEHQGLAEFRALGQLRGVEALEQLLLKWESMEKNWWGGSRYELLKAIAQLMPREEAIEFLIRTEQDEKEDPRVRQKAVLMLIAMRDRKAIDHVVSVYEQAQRQYPNTTRYSLEEQNKRTWPQEEWDQDADRLSQYAELGMLLDPNNKDTDGDGIIDGNDRNPLMKAAGQRTEEQQIAHCLFFFLARYTYLPSSMGPFNFRVWVVQREVGPADEKRPSLFEGLEMTGIDGIILHMNGEQIKKYRSLHGYGTPNISIREDQKARGENERVFHLTEYIAPQGATIWEIHVKKFGDLWLPIYWEITIRA